MCQSLYVDKLVRECVCVCGRVYWSCVHVLEFVCACELESRHVGGHTCMDCVCQGLSVHRCFESWCVQTLVCWVLYVLVRVQEVCVQSSLCEQVFLGVLVGDAWQPGVPRQ